MDDAAFFVKVPGAVELRKCVYECSKDALICLQRFEKFREIRLAKEQAIKELAVTSKSIETLSATLRKMLPLNAESKKEPDLDELKNLEQSITDIENRIKNFKQ